MRWLTERELNGSVVGRWLGRFAPGHDAMDWLMVVDARGTRGVAAIQGLHWMPLARLKSSASLLDYQQWAVAASTPGEQPSMAGPFGSMTWFDDVRDWLHRIAGPSCGPPLFYNVTPHEVVLRISTSRGTVYFKGLTGDRGAEALIAQALWQALPGSFAPTLAYQARADGSVWWVTGHCPGMTVAANFTLERTRLMAAALGRIQQQVADCLADLHVPDADLGAVIKWVSALLEEHLPSEAADRCAAVIARAHETVTGIDVPRSWIPLDLDPGNVLIDGAAVRFIDLDDSLIGATPLALSTFVRKAASIRDHLPDRPLWAEAIRRTYEAAWTPRLRLGQRWAGIDTASMLIDCHLGWQRLVEKIERGEVHGAREHAAARSAQRLARALGIGSPVERVHGSR
jgi:hypothetical protein